jgi:hypothetical protein
MRMYIRIIGILHAMAIFPLFYLGNAYMTVGYGLHPSISVLGITFAAAMTVYSLYD